MNTSAAVCHCIKTEVWNTSVALFYQDESFEHICCSMLLYQDGSLERIGNVILMCQDENLEPICNVICIKTKSVDELSDSPDLSNIQIYKLV